MFSASTQNSRQTKQPPASTVLFSSWQHLHQGGDFNPSRRTDYGRDNFHSQN
jgi:hypothetical protein